MFRSVIVPLDGSEFGERALPLSVVIAEACRAALHLVHVHPATPPQRYLDAPTPLAFQNAPDSTDQHDEVVRSEEQAYLELVARRVRDRVPVTTSEVRLGSVQREVEAAVQNWGADFVVMSTHARAGLSGRVYRSIGQAVMRDLGLPTLLVPAAGPGLSVRFAEAPRRILVTLDGSRMAEAILLPALELAGRVGARIVLLAVQGTPGGLPAYVARIAEILRCHDVVVETRIINSLDPATGILEFVRDSPIDLIAMATHGRTGVTRLLYGSVAERVLLTAQKPILLLRPHALARSHRGQEKARELQAG